MADMHDTFPKVTVEDSRTGRWQTTDRFNLWFWLHGNGECDCNRELLFRDRPCSGICSGSKRYWVVSVEPMPEGVRLEDFNRTYPANDFNRRPGRSRKSSGKMAE